MTDETKLPNGGHFGAPAEEEPKLELSWDAIELTETSRDAVARMGFAAPTEVQQKSIQRVHAGVDLIVQAKTGSGKTLAFGLPILEKLDPDKKFVQALVLSPTRELAVQVAEEISRAGALGNQTVVPIYGGASMNAQIDRLRAGAQIVVGTPGRILDHLRRGTLSLENAGMVVLDEADEMLDRGFLPDVMRLLGHTPSTKQTMLFSATIPSQVRSLADNHLNNPEQIIIGMAGRSINRDIHHSVYRTPKLHKFVTLVNILHSIPRTKVLIFTNMKSDAENTAEHLYEEGFAVGFLSGDLSQAVRSKTLNLFKDGILDVLVATDVAARGIDIFGVSHVINYDIPENKDLYLHRVGRTGRAGHRGEAISLVAPHEILAIGTIQRHMNLTFDQVEVPDKAAVDASVRKTFIGRLKAMESEGYPDDIALFTDELLEALDPYTAAAGLLTMLRQFGWDFAHGYDADNPEHKERIFVRPALLGKTDLKQQAERKAERMGGRSRSGRSGDRNSRNSRNDRGDRAGRRPSSRNEGSRSESSRGERPPKKASDNDKPHPRPSRRKPRSWLALSIGREQGLAEPSDVISLVCQTGGVKKRSIGEIVIEDKQVRFELISDWVPQLEEAFARRKKEPMASIRRLSPEPPKEGSDTDMQGAEKPVADED